MVNVPIIQDRSNVNVTLGILGMDLLVQVSVNDFICFVASREKFTIQMIKLTIINNAVQDFSQTA